MTAEMSKEHIDQTNAVADAVAKILDGKNPMIAVLGVGQALQFALITLPPAERKRYVDALHASLCAFVEKFKGTTMPPNGALV